eukprot:TRINITY_DN2953_c0_g1_i3.p1 TRINITY_DN2953_c0_g1~~TRINITY_DN2953_c0_g1_i3.p1  ORF type:complete len:131 (+),score=38.59 TRINITY_DN2953_c0_g1_i3:99-491(+)
MKVVLMLCLVCLLVVDLNQAAHLRLRREAMPEPQRGGGRSISNRRPGRTQNRFIFGQAGNAGIAGAALGAATQYFTNQVLNPCTRSNNRGSNTNNRFFTGNPTVDNGALGFVAGFASSALLNSALGSPCG